MKPRDVEAVRRSALGYALVAIAATAWGTWPLILKNAPMPAALQSAALMAVLTLASLPVMLRDRVNVRPTLLQWAGVAWLGIGDALNVVLFFAAYQRTTVAIAVLTHYLTPILVALAAPLVLRERPGARTFVAVFIAFAGLVLLLAPWRVGLGGNDAIGAALGAGSAVFYTSNVLVNKRLVEAFSGSEMMFFHGLVATPLLFALVPPSEYALVSRHALGVVMLGALGPGALGGLLFVWGLRRIEASHASVLTLLEPFVAVLLAAGIMGESVGIVSIGGGGLILAGAVLVVTGRPRAPGARPDAAAGNGVQSEP
ncbi:MAG: putative rane protein [Labilithrix sp.]|nr:putative rane protein [Labilithrix sp.]